jgi:hypothetical protein
VVPFRRGTLIEVRDDLAKRRSEVMRDLKRLRDLGATT